jgi:hypothetical protein
MDVLPHWPEKTATVLSTGAGAPHAIPVSTAVRRGDRTLRFALSLRRESLVRLRADPRCAVTVMARGLAFTALGRATVVAELERIAVLELAVEDIQDHDSPRFEIDAGVAWHWTSADDERTDAETRAAIASA